jgi:hypothetical protein
MGSYEIIYPKDSVFKEIKCTWNKSCLDETLPNMAMVAPSVGLWDQLGKLCKKHNNRVGLWRLA